ncbi:gamma-glutamyltranspeptidase 1-like [Paramuricea clavata]|nr:gamma-glutamyltranspeptidase 1-like [Paramuricea clavata]
MLKINETLLNPELGSTLEKIAKDPMSFYHGSIAEQIVRDIRTLGGIITRSDLRNYDAGRAEALQVSLNKKLKIWTSHPPSSGPVLAMILQILKGFRFSSQDIVGDENLVRSYHRIIEAFKFSYAYRALLGDPEYEDGIHETVKNMTSQSFTEKLRRKINDNKIHNISYYGGFYSDWNNQGTTHLSVLSKGGDAVAVTSTINTGFGSKIRSPSLGIVYNNEMDDFSTPDLVNAFGVAPSPNNFIKPNKRMMSSMSPSVVVDDLGNARLILGASGGTRITTGVAQVLMNHLWFGLNLEESVRHPRLHHQLVPNYIRVEKTSKYRMKQAILDGLKKLGHTYKFLTSTSTVQAIAVDEQERIRAVSDPRKHGRAAGY